MSALPEPTPPNKQRDLITRFRDEYATAIAEAEVSEVHTATDGWQKLYAGQRRTEREERRKLADSLRGSADAMEQYGLDEDGEKFIGEIKKASATLRERKESFERQTIDPVRDPVHRCEKLRNEAHAAARSEEERAPLVNIGLEEMMKDAISDVRKPKWDAETGRVIVS